MIHLFRKCIPEGERITEFDSGDAILPPSWFLEGSGAANCVFPCDVFDRWCWTNIFFSGHQSTQFTYTPPARVKPGIWEVTLSASPEEFGIMPGDVTPTPITPTQPLRNGYIVYGGMPCCGPPFASPVFEAILDPDGTLDQVSAAGDGSDAAAFSDVTFEIELDVVTENACCACRNVIPIWNGALNDDFDIWALWSWRVRFVGEWISDFPP